MKIGAIFPKSTGHANRQAGQIRVRTGRYRSFLDLMI